MQRLVQWGIVGAVLLSAGVVAAGEKDASSVAVCFASDVKLTTGVCTSTDANIRATALAVKGDSWIDFTWDASGQCTSLEVNNKSSLEPKR